MFHGQPLTIEEIADIFNKSKEKGKVFIMEDGYRNEYSFFQYDDTGIYLKKIN